MVELADTPDLESGARACEFESHYPYYAEVAELVDAVTAMV